MAKKIRWHQFSKKFDFINIRHLTLVLLASTVIATIVWSFSKAYFEDRALKLFNSKVDTNIDHIDKRINRYEQVLRSGVAFFQGSDHVSAQEWHQFIKSLEIDKNYPGMQGMGFSLMIAPLEVARVEQDMRMNGYPSFTINPKSKRDEYSTILYLEPHDERNLKAIGYDMYSNPKRQEAMKQARDTGIVSASAPVKLVQEIDTDVQPGILLYLPLYKTGNKTETIEEKRQSLIGFVYSPFRMSDLLNTIVLKDETLDFEVYDGNEKSEENFLYSTFSHKSYISKYQVQKTLLVGGRKWDIYFYSTPEFDTSTENKYPLLLTFFGVFVNLVLFMIIASLIQSQKIIRLKTFQLEKNRFWLNSLLKSAADGVHILDANGNLIDYSASFIHSLGYTDDEAKDLTLFDFEAQIAKEALIVMMDSVSEYPVTFETRHRRKDGSILDVEVTSREIVLDGKRYLYCSSRNISDRKNVEKALLHEKETAQNYLDIVDVMIVVIGMDNKVKLINRRGCEIIGYTANEVIGKNWFENFIPDRIKPEINKLADKFQEMGETPKYYENPVLTKNGDERLIAWTNKPLNDSNGVLIGFLSSGEDITNIRIAEKKLYENKVFYETIFASAHEAILILDKNTIVDCNDMAVQLFASHKENLIGANVLDTVWKIECDDTAFNSHLDTACSGKPVLARCSLIMDGVNKEIKNIEITFSKFGNDEGKLIWIARDITQQLEEEKLFRMQTRQAQMGEMVSMIAHQWRQPLSIINAITAQLRIQEEIKDEPDMLLSQKLMKIEQQSNHLSQTISDYRDFFRPDKPKEFVTLSSILNNSLDLIDFSLKSNGIKIIKLIQNDSNVFTYRNELLQVLIALMKNSMDAFIENTIHDGNIILTVDKDDKYTIITILDNAGGISDEVISRLFTPYFTTKNNNLGTGLGLYMSKTIIEDHCEGILSVSSEGDETTFTIKLPL